MWYFGVAVSRFPFGASAEVIQIIYSFRGRLLRLLDKYFMTNLERDATSTPASAFVRLRHSVSTGKRSSSHRMRHGQSDGYNQRRTMNCVLSSVRGIAFCRNVTIPPGIATPTRCRGRIREIVTPRIFETDSSRMGTVTKLATSASLGNVK